MQNLSSLTNRMTFHSFWPRSDTSSGMNYEYAVLPTYPFLRGYDPLGFGTLSGSPYNYCNVLPLQWAMLAFTGYRGGINVSALAMAPGTNGGYMTTLNRCSFGTQIFQQGKLEGASGDDIKISTYAIRAMANGTAINHSSVNPYVSAEIPYHTTKKSFSFARGTINFELR